MLIFLGALPPPVHGMSVMNERVLAYLDDVPVRVFNLVPAYAARFFPGKVFTLLKVLHLALIFLPYLAVSLCYRQRAVVYFSIAGGKGKLLDLPFMWVAGVVAKSIFVHHHSYAYCNEYDPIFSRLIRAGRNKITHVVLGESMRAKLVQLYGISEEDTEVLSNVALFDGAKDIVRRTQVRTIGYISNISFEKGIRDFVETVRQVRQAYPDIQIRIAGPCVDEDVREYVLTSCHSIPGMQYLGPVYGASKDDFFADIDVLLFPTHYVNEAEPLVIHEAFLGGIPVIASGRGCIPDLIRQGAGASLSVDGRFVEAAVAILSRWLRDANEYSNEVMMLCQHYPVYRQAMKINLYKLLGKIKIMAAQ